MTYSPDPEDEMVMGHAFVGSSSWCTYELNPELAAEGRTPTVCGYGRSQHANPGTTHHLVEEYPHEFMRSEGGGDHCTFGMSVGKGIGVMCGYPEAEHHVRRPVSVSAVVRMADVAQYAREPMPDAARGGISVSLIDAPTDPLGTLAVLTGIYEGKVYRSKGEITDEQRRAALEAMLATVLSGPLEAIQFTFLVEGVSRAITHQMVRNRFSFFAQESLRFAVADDWAQEVPLPPSLAGLASDDPRVMVWRRGLNQAEDSYAALVSAGMPAEEARGLLPHAITTRIFWSVSLRTLLMEAGKRTCTQAQFDWRSLFAGVAKVLRERSKTTDGNYWSTSATDGPPYGTYASDGWQYEGFADLIRPVCYQQGKCGFMAVFDRGCSIRERVDAFERAGVPSSEWGVRYSKERGTDSEVLRPIYPAEWAADHTAARVTE